MGAPFGADDEMITAPLMVTVRNSRGRRMLDAAIAAGRVEVLQRGGHGGRGLPSTGDRRVITMKTVQADSMVKSLLEPDYVAVAWDKPKTNIRKRRELYPEYKAGRKPAPADFYAQVPILHELLDAFGWPFYELDDYEADDILGAFAKQATEKGIETCLLTSDLDALQLVGPLTKVYAIKNGLSNLEEV